MSDRAWPQPDRAWPDDPVEGTEDEHISRVARMLVREGPKMAADWAAQGWTPTPQTASPVSDDPGVALSFAADGQYLGVSARFTDGRVERSWEGHDDEPG